MTADSWKSLKLLLLFVVVGNIYLVYVLYSSHSKNLTPSLYWPRLHHARRTLPSANPLTSYPTLKNLDGKILFGQNSFPLHNNGTCSNLEKPRLDLTEGFRWQFVTNGVPDTFVFSAYYDPRVKPSGAVRIMGISSGQLVGVSSPTKFCQLWYEDDVNPTYLLAEYTFVPETHFRKYAASFHICYLTNQRIPYAVSLTTTKCASANNVLKVIRIDSRQKPEVDFTVCVTPLNFNYDDVRHLVEVIEVNRLLGAERFVFYNYSSGQNVTSCLLDYSSEDVVRVIPWKIPVVVDVFPPDPTVEPHIHYFGQLAALNDCLYRNMFRSRFIVFTDLDELVVPRINNTWLDMLEAVTVQWFRSVNQNKETLFPGAYMFRSSFFRLDWLSNASTLGNLQLQRISEELDLRTMLKVWRESKIHGAYQRSKCIVWSKAVAMVGVHNVFYFIDTTPVMHLDVPSDNALLHHYRLWFNDEDSNDRVLDLRMHSFAEDIISRTRGRYKAVMDRIEKLLLKGSRLV